MIKSYTLYIIFTFNETNEKCNDNEVNWYILLVFIVSCCNYCQLEFVALLLLSSLLIVNVSNQGGLRSAIINS